MIHGKVRHGIVEPDIAFATDTSIDVLHRLSVDHGDDSLSCPHDLYLGVHLCAEDVEVGSLGPCLVVLRGA